jgi:hypothetical protein
MSTSTITTAVPTTTTVDPTTTAAPTTTTVAPTTTTVAPTTTTAAPTTTTTAPTTTALATSTITTSTSTTTVSPTSTTFAPTTTVFPTQVGTQFPGLENSAISKYNPFPYQHWIIENAINPVLASFIHQSLPSSNSLIWSSTQNDFQKKKTSAVISSMGTPTQVLFNMLFSSAFTSTLSAVTGIPNLFPDASLYEAGVSVYEKGDYITPNLDYEINPFSGMEKRVGVLIFLAPDWNISYGGSTIMWDDLADRPTGEVLPLHTRMFIYKNEGLSWTSLRKILDTTKRLVVMSASYMTQPRPTARNKRRLFVPNVGYEST